MSCERCEQLQHALDSRILIEQAKGFVAGKHEVPVDQAFEQMRTFARAHQIKLVFVCDMVLRGNLRYDSVIAANALLAKKLVKA